MPNSIKGSFRVFELLTLVKSGDLHPHSLVTAIHVEDYGSEDDKSSRMSE